MSDEQEVAAAEEVVEEEVVLGRPSSRIMSSSSGVLKEGTADFYRRRFESSVFGQHSMLPPREVSDRFKSKEEPSNYPSGQDTSFQNLTPMPFRFTDNALVLQTPKKVELPYYQTTTSEVGKMPVGSVDLPMRWYGRSGMFTSSWVAPPKTKVSTGLNTAMFHSDIHPTQDQGWSGHLGLTDYNVANLKASTFVGKAPRTTTLA